MTRLLTAILLFTACSAYSTETFDLDKKIYCTSEDSGFSLEISEEAEDERPAVFKGPKEQKLACIGQGVILCKLPGEIRLEMSEDNIYKTEKKFSEIDQQTHLNAYFYDDSSNLWACHNI